MSKKIDWISDAIRDVAELPDRSSPEGQPDMMLVTAAELRMILERHSPQHTVEFNDHKALAYGAKHAILLEPEGIDLLADWSGYSEREGVSLDDVCGLLLWIGFCTADDGSKVYGLHAANAECPEEGSVTLAEFGAPDLDQEKQARPA